MAPVHKSFPSRPRLERVVEQVLHGTLIVTENGRVRDHVLKDHTSVGRSLENDIQILDLRSSKIHCRIVRDENGFTLVDEGSTNGTRLNGKPTRRALLQPGDVFEIGDVKFAYQGDPPVGGTSSAETVLGGDSAAAATTAVAQPRQTASRAAAPAAGLAAVSAEVEPVLESIPELEEVLDWLVRERGSQGLLAADALLRRHMAASTAVGAVAARGDEAVSSVLVFKLKRILEGNARLLSERSLKKLLEALLDAAVEISGAERGFIILRSGGADRSLVAAARNIDRESLRRPAEKFSRSIADEVLASGAGIVSANASEDVRFGGSGSVSELKLRSILCAPILEPSATEKKRRSDPERRALGVIYVDNRFSEAVFTEEDLDLLQSLGTQAAIAVENARLFEAEQRTSAQLAESRAELQRVNRELETKLEQKSKELVELRSNLPAPDKRDLRFDYDKIIGNAPAMFRLFETLDRVIESSVPVLIQGESGTGKELVAQAIHRNSSRKDRAFVTENCAAISETLLESELFGHVRGAFTDAHADKPGLFEVADGGTLFLDEIGDMSPGMQKKLLRALQGGEVRRVGGKKVINVDVRVIAASNKVLRDMIKTGEFREDLYYRLNVITVELPPLRERREDIPLLVSHFLEVIARESGRTHRITREAEVLLCRHDWPGNVRELENEVRRACALSDDVIDVETLSNDIQRLAGRAGADLATHSVPSDPGAVGELPPGVGLKELVKSQSLELERRVISTALEDMGWRKTEVAERLRISRPTLDAKLELFGLKPPADES